MITSRYCNTHRVSLRRTKGWCPACAMATELHAAAMAKHEADRWSEQAKRWIDRPHRFEEYRELARMAHNDMLEANSRAIQCRDSYDSLLMLESFADPCPCDDAQRIEYEQTRHEDERLRLMGVER